MGGGGGCCPPWYDMSGDVQVVVMGEVVVYCRVVVWARFHFSN